MFFLNWLLSMARLCCSRKNDRCGRLMAKRMRCYAVSNEKPIRLNVGGKIFDVGMEVINSFQYLQARLGDNFQSPLYKAGPLFVDRCPELFEVLLQSVRSLTRPSQRYILDHKRDLLAECEFSNAFSMIHTIHQNSCQTNSLYDHNPHSLILNVLCHGASLKT